MMQKDLHLVILFDKGSYGIIDFKTTNLSLDKAEVIKRLSKI